MVRNFRLYLTALLILFTLVFSIAIGVFDYYKGQQQIRATHEKEIDMIQDAVMQSLYTIDQMYILTNETLGDKMKGNMDVLLDKYKENPDFESWDFKQLSEQFDMDVFIIDDTNTVVYASFEQDIGLNFDECCGTFAQVIKDRRLGTAFKHDGMDLQQSSGEIKKFAYMPTHDHRYLFELSMALEDGEVFKTFNILKRMKELEQQYKPIHSIRLYNTTGLSFESKDHPGGPNEISAEMRPVFEEAKMTHEKKELMIKEDGMQVTYRYIPYDAVYNEDFNMMRVVEIIYSEVELAGVLKFYRDGFIYQQLIIVIAVILLALFIGKILSNPVHLAFHDRLTNLKNRAAFEIEGQEMLKKQKGKISFMMIDLDNFKHVNDQLGHVEGDKLLREIGDFFNRYAQSDSFIARIGGDEFIIIYSGMTKNDLQLEAENLLKELNQLYEELNSRHALELSISIGIAFFAPVDDIETLYNKADQALYEAKRNGKNQYAFYDDIENPDDMFEER